MLSREEFKKRLKKAGWTQAQVARAMNKDPSWLNKIIGGTRGMNQKLLLQVAVLTGIPPNDLLGWEEKPAPSDDEIIREAVDQMPTTYLRRLVDIGRERLEKEKPK